MGNISIKPLLQGAQLFGVTLAIEKLYNDYIVYIHLKI